MKIYLFSFLFLLGILGGMCGCSSDENSAETDFGNLILDDNIGEKWEGIGLPSWLEKRYFDFVLHETEWLAESYKGYGLCEVYKFSYKGNLLLALTYSRFALKQNYYYESGTLCYTDDGRRVRFEDVKDDFKENSVLLWSNRFDNGSVPQVADFGLKGVESLGWLQDTIDKICKDIQEPEQLLGRVACGYAYSNDHTYIVLDYVYFDKNNLDEGEIKIRNVYTLEGERVNIFENIDIKEENLCVQEIVSMFAGL
jgi:hypothetical protein